MFIDELKIRAHAGKGGDGVVRWLRERARPLGGPAGGNGGRGGDVYVVAVRDLGLLAKYRGEKEFRAEDGVSGMGKSQYGKAGEDCIIEVPVGSIVTDVERGYRYEFFTEGAREKILKGGSGGLGNEYFKSSVNRQPTESTLGKSGESGEFTIELELVVDVGIIGLPNAGKSSLLNALTHAHSKVASYAFTTLEPHLGDLHGFVLADIPGLIEGAAEGKGLGHKFLKHIRRTKMLLHCISLENEFPLVTYDAVRHELGLFDASILEKKEIVLLTKSDTVTPVEIEETVGAFAERNIPARAITVLDDAVLKELSDELVRTLRREEDSATIA